MADPNWNFFYHFYTSLLALLILSTLEKWNGLTDALLLKDENGILAVFKNLLFTQASPSAIYSCQKLGYLFLMLAPMCFLPLLYQLVKLFFGSTFSSY